jgi:RNA polymerase sigma factor (sigma-70 family)
MIDEPITTSEQSDHQLLRQYAHGGSQRAFATLVERHLGLVYSAARRQVRDANDAQDVAQAVFWVLSRKAGSLAGDPDLVLPAWLWRTTRLASLNATRGERRLKRRERTAAQMNSDRQNEFENRSSTLEWDEVAPHLDAALSKLREVDRRAVILRFFENRTLREVGASLGVSEDAAKQRVLRAVGRLRAILDRRGVRVASVTGLASLVTTNAAQGAPPALAAQITSSLLAGAAAPMTAVPFLAKATLHAVAYSKAKAVAVAIAVALIAAAGAAVVGQALAGRSGAGAQRSPTAPNATRPTTRAAAPDPDARADDWRSRFNSAYSLGAGEVLKRLPPPAIPERQRLFDQLDPRRQSFDPRAGYLFVWRDGTMESLRGPLGPHTLGLLLSYGLEIPSYSVELPDAIRAMRLSGDWVVRHGAGDAERLAALSKIVERDWGRRIRFEKRALEREVLVATGKLKAGEANAKEPLIDLFTTARPADDAKVQGDVAHLLRTVGELVGLMIVDESPRADVKVAWRFGKGVRPNTELSAEHATLLLDHLSDQIGLDFKREIRPVEVWVGREIP